MRNRFLDPLYGVVPSTDFEMRLLLAPEVQRLRYVRMCNINSMLISGASEISRFEHIVGVFHLAQLWTRQNRLHPHQCKLLHAAAILHDLQTGPFGHSLEYILDDNEVEGEFNHEDVQGSAARTFLQDFQAAASFRGAQFQAKNILGHDWQAVAEMIGGSGRLGPLVSAELDIDNIDNVLRLAFHVGVVERDEARDLAESIVSDMGVLNGELTLSERALPQVARWQDVRANLYRLLLHDWAEFSAKAMLTRVIEEAVRLGKLSADNWILTDDGLVDHLAAELTGEGGAAKEILDRLVRGALYEPAVLASVSGTQLYDHLANIQTKRDIEAKLSSVAGTKVIFHVIKDKNKTNRAVKFFNRDTNKRGEVGISSDETLIGVFLSTPDNSERTINNVQMGLDEALGSIGLSGELAILPDPTTPFDRTGSRENRQLGLFDEA